MRYQHDINTEHTMKSICHAAVAQWTTRLTRTGQTRIREAHILDITLAWLYTGVAIIHAIILYTLFITPASHTRKFTK